MTIDIALVPGLPNTAAVFGDVRAALPANLRCHVLDNPGHSSIDAIAAYWLERLPTRFWLCGFSFGGYVALAILAAARQRVAGIALLCASPLADDPALAPRRAAAIEAVARGGYLEMLRAQVPFVFHPDRAGDAQLTQRLWRMVEAYGPERYADHTRALASRPDRVALLDDTSLPILLVAAAQDVLVPPQAMRKIADPRPHIRMEVVPDCGHMLPLEKPRELAGLLTDWVHAA